MIKSICLNHILIKCTVFLRVYSNYWQIILFYFFRRGMGKILEIKIYLKKILYVQIFKFIIFKNYLYNSFKFFVSTYQKVICKSPADLST